MSTFTAMTTLSKAEVKMEIFVTRRLAVTVSRRMLLMDNLMLLTIAMRRSFVNNRVLAVARGALLVNDGVLAVT